MGKVANDEVPARSESALLALSISGRLRNRVLSYPLANEGAADHPFRVLRRARDDALAFIDLIPAAAVPPHVGLSEDGEINFSWNAAGACLDIGFDGDGKLHYFVQSADRQIDADGSLDFSGRELPGLLIEAIPERGAWGYREP